MNQVKSGKFIAQKRKEKNLTQEQLAERLGISNKTVSKWECGKCAPAYSIINDLCKTLEITVAELIDGEEKEDGATQESNQQQILDMLERIQRLERQKSSLLGIVLIAMGMALIAFSQSIGGTDFKDFIAGLIMGLSVGEMLVGIFMIGRSYGKQ